MAWTPVLPSATTYLWSVVNPEHYFGWGELQKFLKLMSFFLVTHQKFFQISPFWGGRLLKFSILMTFCWRRMPFLYVFSFRGGILPLDPSLLVVQVWWFHYFHFQETELYSSTTSRILINNKFYNRNYIGEYLMQTSYSRKVLQQFLFYEDLKRSFAAIIIVLEVSRKMKTFNSPPLWDRDGKCFSCAFVCCWFLRPGTVIKFAVNSRVRAEYQNFLRFHPQLYIFRAPSFPLDKQRVTTKLCIFQWYSNQKLLERLQIHNFSTAFVKWRIKFFADIWFHLRLTRSLNRV